jgi:hypothetical protein
VTLNHSAQIQKRENNLDPRLAGESRLFPNDGPAGSPGQLLHSEGSEGMPEKLLGPTSPSSL